ncbi:MAG: dephospho-CoA kinase [Erysipelotrichaceae bacterium]
MKKIGLTGSIGSGKSTCIKILQKHHIRVFDCDKINHDLIQKNGLGYQKIVAAFGPSILNKEDEIDPKLLSELIFKNKEKKQQLENLIHPCIKSVIQSKFREYKNDAMIVVEVPLLFEVNWIDEFDEIWLIASLDEIRINRLTKERGMDIKDVKKRMAAQMPQSEKIKRADHVIFNNGSLSELEKKIENLLYK